MEHGRITPSRVSTKRLALLKEGKAPVRIVTDSPNLKEFERWRDHDIVNEVTTDSRSIPDGRSGFRSNELP